jgi:hypothetical protein
MLGSYYEGGGAVCAKFENPRKSFDKGSFRWTKSADGTRVLIGCPKGSWDASKKRCRVGTKAHKVYLFTDKKRCPKGYRRQ